MTCSSALYSLMSTILAGEERATRLPCFSWSLAFVFDFKGYLAMLLLFCSLYEEPILFLSFMMKIMTLKKSLGGYRFKIQCFQRSLESNVFVLQRFYLLIRWFTCVSCFKALLQPVMSNLGLKEFGENGFCSML